MELDRLWGAGRDLTMLQMGVRAFVVFFITLVLVRVSGRRSFARRSAFDNIIVIMLGSVLTRPIYGASPFWPVMIGSTVMVVIHRVLGIASARWPRLERLVKGRAFVLWKDRVLDERTLIRHELSRGDLDAAVHLLAHRARFTEVDEIRLESNGDLTVVDDRS